MLNIVYGKAGSGKTEFVNKILTSLAREGCEDLLLVVPEQFSFTAERAMLETLGPVDCNKVEVVMSFSHIAETVRREYGSAKLREISSGEKILLMSMAVKQVEDKLEFFSRRVKSKGFVKEMISLCDEFRQNALSPETALEFCENIESGNLRKKLEEVSLVLESYDALLKNRFSDPFDVLTRLYDVLGEYSFFENKTVVIDGFYSFSRQELKIIERMMAQAKDIYITVCADKLFAGEGEDYDVFSYPRKTARSVIEIAKRYNKEVKSIHVEKENKISREISFLEENIFRADKKVFENETEDIEIISAKNIENECKLVALTIKKILGEGKARSRDIAVVSRDGGEYDVQVKEALKKYGVEVFSDKLQPVKIQPLCTYLSGALEIAAYGINESRVMKCLKTGLTDLNTDEVSELENYALMWGMNAPFNREWTENPRGFGEEIKDEDRENLAHLNSLRKTAMKPLLDFKEAISKGVSGVTAAEEMYKLLINSHADENLKKLAINLEEMCEEELALEQERIWEIIIKIIDSFASVVADDRKSAEEIYSLFDAVITNEEMGVLPQGLDEVLVGNAERTRVSSPEIVFVVGANDGIFPRVPSVNGIFNDREKNLLLEGGLPLNAPVLDRILEERFIAYHTIASAKKKIYISYCGHSVSEELYPSEIVSEVRELFPKCRFTDAEKVSVYDYVFSDVTAFDVMAETWRSDNAQTNSLKKYFSEDMEYAKRIEALEKYLNKEKIHIEDKEKAKELFGKNMFLSASRIETFYKCPFQYFCKFGLRAKPEEKAEISPRQRGTVVHFCLEKLIKEYGIEKLKGCDKKELEKIISCLLEEYAETSMGGQENKSKRFEFLYSRFEKTVYELITGIIDEFSASDFEPCGFELVIDRDGEVPPYEISLDDGKIFVRGLVDRVDIMEKNNEKYIRVVDYKTGGKDFKLHEVLEGINMQMLIYLFAIETNGKDRYENCIPAGVLYKPAKFGQLKTKRYVTEEELAKERKKEGKYSGLVLAHEDVIYGMDKNATGEVIDVTVKEDKDNKIIFKGSVATLSQLGKLKNRVDRIIATMGNELHSGNVQVLPFEGKTDKACTFCDYKDVCMRKDEDECRQSSGLGNEEIFEIFEEEEGEENVID